MKVCYTCKVEKDLNEFGKDSKKPDGLQINCRPCKKAYDNAYHANRSDDRKQEKIVKQYARIAANRAYIQSLRESSPCTDCGQFYPSYVMDFDHIGDDKIGNLGNMVSGFGLDMLIKEIAKCELVCSNCHRIRTHKRRTGV